MNWNIADYIAAIFLISSLSFLINRARKYKGKKRILMILFFILAFMLVWAELAVGIFNSPFAGS